MQTARLLIAFIWAIALLGSFDHPVHARSLLRTKHKLFSPVRSGFSGEACTNGLPENFHPKPKFCFLVPTTTRKLNVDQLQQDITQLPLLKTFMESVARTCNSDRDRLEYAIFVGYDPDDRFYTNPDNQVRIRTWVTERFAGSHVFAAENLQLIQFSHKAPLTTLWNNLFDIAIGQGCHYHYAIGDDVELETERQCHDFVELLQARRNFGLVGPSDLQMMHIPHAEQCVVSTLHKKIFGWLFPPEIHDFGSDVWLWDVYRPFSTVSTEHHVRNTIRSRHAAIPPTTEKQRSETEQGRQTLCNYLTECGVYGADSMCTRIRQHATEPADPTIPRSRTPLESFSNSQSFQMLKTNLP